ncbi:MAG: Rid family hydrolase, partial [Gammaproteobacteria bacterium]|nr:Rid family hydrolase [Gammaproteobacteria bacterium]
MTNKVETSTPDGIMKPIGPYSHIARAGNLIMISATAGVDPASNELAGPDVGSQPERILLSFARMLESAGSDFAHALHINVFLKDMADFEEMNRAYGRQLGPLRPARTTVAVVDLPKP